MERVGKKKYIGCSQSSSYITFDKYSSLHLLSNYQYQFHLEWIMHIDQPSIIAGGGAQNA